MGRSVYHVVCQNILILTQVAVENANQEKYLILLTVNA